MTGAQRGKCISETNHVTSESSSSSSQHEVPFPEKTVVMYLERKTRPCASRICLSRSEKHAKDIHHEKLRSIRPTLRCPRSLGEVYSACARLLRDSMCTFNSCVGRCLLRAALRRAAPSVARIGSAI